MDFRMDYANETDILFSEACSLAIGNERDLPGGAWDVGKGSTYARTSST
jgi:hypothetical protein